MSYQVLARKYRPQRFADVIGQEHVTRTLRNAIAQQRIAHGYIFSGHRGIGKTTVARILAMCLNCRSFEQPTADPCGTCDSCNEIRAGQSVDVIEIDAATNRGIDEIRELRDAVRYRPARDRFKVYILDEAHQITDAAFNALLKTLEEPPGHVIFMLATTQPEDIPQTIRSRCQHFSFHAVRFEDMVGQLRDIAQRENLAADDDALALLAEAGDGSMRDALSLMDQASASSGGRLTAESVRGLVGWVSSEIFEQLMQSVSRSSAEEVLRLADRVLTEGHNPAHLTRQLVRFLRNCIVAKVAGEDPALLQVAPDEARRVMRVAALFSEEDLTRFLQILLRTHAELNYKREQRFHLELGLLKLVHAQRLLPIEEMLSGAEPAARTPGEGKPRATVAPARSAPSPEPPSRPRTVSPFEADRARKSSTSKEEMSSSSAPVAVAERSEPGAEGAADVRAAVVGALEQGGQRMVAAMLGAGEWTVTQEEIRVRVAGSTKMADLALNGDVRRIATAAAASAAGRPLKLRVEGTGAANGSTGSGATQAETPPAASGRSRATKDPVVRRMQEKFGAEIRSVIDHREKRR
ncbi:MAG TPA: DNA polymerase III subunit gamma/tau [Terriglobales bacterium]|nr:DNA polymerase III subunit gamma/tau [Terriglobales bacterium]